MASKFLNISTDNTLGGNSPSDVIIPSQKATKEYIDQHGGGGGSVSIDNKSITTNASDQIQTVGVIDQNNISNAINIWTGPEDKYDEIGTYFAYRHNSDVVYVRKVAPTTSDTVYTGIGTASALTITAVGTASITLSDGYAYTRVYGDLVDDTLYSNTTLYNIEDETEDFEQLLNLPFSLFEYQFTDHLLNNASWLRADTFSWQSGAVYVSAYGKLVEEYATGTTQTEDGITYKLTTNGFKIAEADQESAISTLFNSTGKAWFYILDTANQRFKLPRELPFDGQAKGNGMTLGLTNGTSNAGLYCSSNTTDVQIGKNMYGQSVGYSASGTNITELASFGVTTDSTKSGIIHNRDNTDSQKYLYFYVGETVNNANLIDAGSALEDINDLKAHYVTETYENGTSWYRVYSDGWCEQGSQEVINAGSALTVTLLKSFINTNYTITSSAVVATNSSYNSCVGVSVNGVSSIYLSNAESGGTAYVRWIACGYIS